MKPIIDHIQITVKNVETAEAFYDKLTKMKEQPHFMANFAKKQTIENDT